MTYIAIDLKSFYASVECIERGLDPLTTNLVVADLSRTQKTICLAVSPSLKSYGISGRARLFEAVTQVKNVNQQRRKMAPCHKFRGASFDAKELKDDFSLSVDYIVAPPRMALYIDYSTRIFKVYLKHIAPEDIHVYSIDEVFIDATAYLKASGLSAYDFTRMIVKDVLDTTGITATAGIGTNMYLSKVAMDITAKHIPADKDGVRIAELDEMTYRRKLWSHKPITDFWRVGKGYAKSLENNGMYTMGDVARCSLENESLLYKLFGVNAELLIDHAWGYEPCTIKDIKSYKPSTNSISTGQVMRCPTKFDTAKLITMEMADMLALDLVGKELVTEKLVLVVGYDAENLISSNIKKSYTGQITTDHYGRKIPKHARGTANVGRYTSSAKFITDAVSELFDRIVDKNLLVRRINLTAIDVIGESDVISGQNAEQLSMFDDFTYCEQEDESLEKERNMQKAMIDIKNKYGKNAILKGMNLKEGATAKERNGQIGGHRA